MEDMAERNEEDADELLHTDLSVNSGFKWHCPVRLDHCDLLLDAMDAQLDQLQVQPVMQGAFSRELDSNDAVCSWSQSLSKDTGLGSTSQTNDTPMSCLELMLIPAAQQIEDTAGSTAAHKETKKRRDEWSTHKEAAESRREQVLWRLERLLGDRCKEAGMAGETQPPSDSICTEDFFKRFSEEMVGLAVPHGSTQEPDRTEETTLCDSDEYSNVAPVERQMSKTNISHSADVLTHHEIVQHNNSCSPKARCLAGVPVLSFDSVSIDSDLDSVCTDQVRQHIHKSPGWQSLIQCVTDLNDPSTTHSDSDTLTLEESEPQSTAVQRSPCRQNRSISVRKVQHSRRETARRVCPLSDRDTDEEMNPYSEKSEWTSQSDWIKLKTRLSNLRQKCGKEEAALRLRKTQLREVELCLTELRQKKKHAFRSLARLTAKMAQMEKERRVLEGVLIDRRVEEESLCCELQNLQRQNESTGLEVRDTERDLTVLSQRKHTPNDAAVMNRRCRMVLEREEVERQLDSAKTQLFPEQQRAGEELEAIKENLEETCEELQRATEVKKTLKNRCSVLEEKHMEKRAQIKALEAGVSKLQDELAENQMSVGTLETMLAQKELQLLDSKEQCDAFQTEIDGQKRELKRLTSQHDNDLRERAHEIMLKEEELKMLRKCLQQQKEEAKKREEEVNVETLQKVQEAVKEERMKWEAERVQQCAMLEEQNRDKLEVWRNEIHQERSVARGLQHEVVELKNKVQQLEAERRTQQREQESLLAVVCKSLQEEHQAEVQRLQTHMAQQSQATVLQLQQDVGLAVRETDRLRAELEERECSQKQIRAGEEEKLRVWAQQLVAECQHLHLLVEQNGNTEDQHSSVTVAEALQLLRTVREQLKHFISHLHHQLDSQKQSNEQLREDKERELSIQRQQLRAERDQALNSVKERLIQEHIEELSSLKWTHMSDGAADGGGAAASLRRQLRAKDFELQQVQRSMAQWKEQTTARLACKFEEELTIELERKSSKSQNERPRRPQRLEVEMIGAKEALCAVCSPRLHAVASAAPHSASDVASLKLLCYLQSRVKQLRVENQSFMWRSDPSETVCSDRSGSYLASVMKHASGTSTLTEPVDEHQ